jgi:GDP/UDP-N,N'-diacetylbacillosamine 2-epimerase (hydrolysing)
MKRKVCIVTGSRAEYGLLRWVMKGINESARLKLQLVVTGMHLSPEFGLTYREIEADGFTIDRRVEMLISSDTPVGIAKSMGLGLLGFADVFAQLKPDLLLILGDRFEILAAATAAMVARLPIAHLHGGEATEGLIDEAIRHSVTKMSHLHFVAAEEYRQRVIQLGEQPSNVYLVGGLGIDSINNITLMGRDDLERDIGFKFLKKNIMVTFHPVTLDDASAQSQMTELLAALSKLSKTGIIFTMPNADTDGRILIAMIENFVKSFPNACAYKSLGQLRYLSCLAQVDAVVGNSSSGIVEVPSFKKATINIGDRQRGRLRATSIIDCAIDRTSIIHAIDTAYSPMFKEKLKTVKNPYGEGGASEKIIETLSLVNLQPLIKKKFYDCER